MSAAELNQQVGEIIGLVLQMPPPAGELARKDEPRWDSLKHVEIVFALEDACGVTFTEEDMAAMDSIGSIVQLIERRKAAA